MAGNNDSNGVLPGGRSRRPDGLRGSRPLGQIAVPLVCIGAYLLWTGSGVQRTALHQLIPVTTKDWLVVLPYVLLVPMLLGRDHVQRWLLRRAAEREAAQPT